MSDSSPTPAWSNGNAYELYMGRWSRQLARKFLAWLKVPPRMHWLDVGCGTGALSKTILATAAPLRLEGLDFSAAFIEHARAHIGDAQASFSVGDAQDLPYGTASFDVTVSGLALNFVPDPARALAEMVRVTRLGGTVAIYIWDYANGMEMMHTFWDAAVALDSRARERSETLRAPLGDERALQDRFRETGLNFVSSKALELPMRFADFDDYWAPFLSGQGPAPSYLMSLSEAHRNALRDLVHSSLPIAEDGRLELHARAWAVRGKPSVAQARYFGKMHP